jgi:hypothetical protein
LGATVKCPWALAGTGPGATTPVVRESGASSTPSNVRWDPYSIIDTLPDGSPCWGTEYRPRPVDSVPDPWATSIMASGSGEVYPLCPPAAATARQSATAVAMRAWEEVPLPAPKPHIAPGRAITGKLAYIETRGQTEFTFTKETGVGTLQIRAKGRYTVDWGDGETSGPHSAEGKPWPDGEITHGYISVGSYDVVVTERWTATWHIGQWSGQLSELRTVGRIDDFPVQQIQAVVLASSPPP